MIDRRYICSFDWISFFIITALSLIGLLTVLSATYKPECVYSLFYKKQLFGIVTGLLFYCGCCVADYRSAERIGYFIYFIVLLMLVFTLIKGKVALGGQRWINLGLFKFQPSELAKIFLAPFISYYLATEKRSEQSGFKTFVPLIFILGISALLIHKQPDLGTALIVLFSGLTVLGLAGLDKKFFLILAALSLVLAPIGWKVLKPYQQKRILTYCGEGDSRKERYQIEQSVIAVGSGGISGKGFLHGTQNKFDFLPAGRTDFIFSVFCEEWGFVGALILLLLYCLLFFRLFRVIITFKNFYAQLFATGLLLPLLFSVIFNIGMVLGLLPVVGIPLPFMTYGLSHLWMSFISLGFVQSAVMRRFMMTTPDLDD